MAILSPTNNQLPTAWLAPPEGLFPSSHKVTIQPAPIATSAVLAVLIALAATLIFNKKKKAGCLDDMTPQTEGADNELSELEPCDVEEVGNIAARPDQARIKPASRRSSTSSSRSQRAGRKDYLGANLPTIRQPAPAHHRNRNLDDGTSLADDNNMFAFSDDAGTLRSEASYRGYRHEDFLSSCDLPGYAPSHVPSVFKPLPPEEVGMEGKLWK